MKGTILNQCDFRITLASTSVAGDVKLLCFCFFFTGITAGKSRSQGKRVPRRTALYREANEEKESKGDEMKLNAKEKKGKGKERMGKERRGEGERIENGWDERTEKVRGRDGRGQEMK